MKHMYIDHPRRVFLAGYDWFEGKMLYFFTQIRVYHILFTEGTTENWRFWGIDFIL